MLLATALLWSTGGLLIKLVDWHPVAISGMRSAIAALTIFLVACRRPRFTWSAVQVGGALAYAGTVTFLVIATKMTTAANAILLQYTAPIYIAVLGYRFVKERSSKFDWLVVTLTMGGMFLFFIDDLTAGSLWGNTAGLLSGLSFGLFILCMRKQKDGSPIETVLLGNIITTLVCLPFMFTGAPDVSGWGALIPLGIFQLGFAYIIYSRAIKHVTALEGVLVPVIEPVFNPIWVFLFLGELPGFYSIIGGTVILCSITMLSIVKALSSSSSARKRAFTRL